MEQLYNNLSLQFELNDFMLRHGTQASFIAKREQLVSLLTNLRDIHGYTHLVMVTCVDWLEDKLFQLTYIVHNHHDQSDIIVKVLIDRDMPEMDSIHHLWEQGRVFQRELHEMFGISFPGSPGQDEPMILEGWQGPPPMRRDFDTKEYCEANYSNRERDSREPEEHMQRKLYPED